MSVANCKLGAESCTKENFSENVTLELITFSILHIHLQTYEYMALGFSKLDISFVYAYNESICLQFLKSPNFIRTKDRHRITYVLAS